MELMPIFSRVLLLYLLVAILTCKKAVQHQPRNEE